MTRKVFICRKTTFQPIQHVVYCFTICDLKASQMNVQRISNQIVPRTTTIKQRLVGLKPCIPKLCSKPLRQIHQVALWKFLASLTPQTSVWFFAFTASAEELPNYASHYQNIPKPLTHPCTNSSSIWSIRKTNRYLSKE